MLQCQNHLLQIPQHEILLNIECRAQSKSKSGIWAWWWWSSSCSCWV